ncbi:hypothetical protein MVEN_00097900 [Mycena venus]|uniref:Uncharacterized protein n=1 Tax=Mycena venus TaxID=2733690 RepID=A0A8H6Z8R4_9AGAR|nr:hypothetical protein MVEN_00097900 [Mycena venus]
MRMIYDRSTTVDTQNDRITAGGFWNGFARGCYTFDLAKLIETATDTAHATHLQPQSWPPLSLQSFNVLRPEDITAAPMPLPPVSPSINTLIGMKYSEDRNSWDPTLGSNPYHPEQWNGHLPGPAPPQDLLVGIDVHLRSRIDLHSCRCCVTFCRRTRISLRQSRSASPLLTLHLCPLWCRWLWHLLLLFLPPIFDSICISIVIKVTNLPLTLPPVIIKTVVLAAPGVMRNYGARRNVDPYTVITRRLKSGNIVSTFVMLHPLLFDPYRFIACCSRQPVPCAFVDAHRVPLHA